MLVRVRGRNFDRVCDGDRYDDRVTENRPTRALERGYQLAFRERAGGWEAAWRPTDRRGGASRWPAGVRIDAPPAAAERALAAISRPAA